MIDQAVGGINFFRLDAISFYSVLLSSFNFIASFVITEIYKMDEVRFKELGY